MMFLGDANLWKLRWYLCCIPLMDIFQSSTVGIFMDKQYSLIYYLLTITTILALPNPSSLIPTISP